MSKKHKATFNLDDESEKILQSIQNEFARKAKCYVSRSAVVRDLIKQSEKSAVILPIKGEVKS